VSQSINAGEIDYDALEVALVKRFASDCSFRVSYTLGYSRGKPTGAAIPLSGFQVLDDLFVDVFNVTDRANFENPTAFAVRRIPESHGNPRGWVRTTLQIGCACSSDLRHGDRERSVWHLFPRIDRSVGLSRSQVLSRLPRMDRSTSCVGTLLARAGGWGETL
jgi:hypothetical protein